MSLVYKGYLLRFEEDSVDAITQFVSKNTEQLFKLFHGDFYMKEISNTSYIMLYYHQKAVARVIEGCNAINVIILFASFVVSFSGKWKATFFFIVGGSIFIYILNVFRIALLCLALDRFPEYQSLLHQVVFPLFIYGIVFILWVVWVNKFSLYAK